MNVGFVTCDAAKLACYFPTLAEPYFVPTELPFTPDDQLAVNALRQKGHHVVAVQWGAPVSSLVNLDCIVVRSPWDYMDSAENVCQFFNWIEAIDKSGIAVANPFQFMRWLLDKHYLADIATQGISVIPTTYLDVNSQLDLPALYQSMGAYILKPCISAAGVGLYFIKSYSDALALQNEVSHYLSERTYMLQTFIPEIITKGEWSLMFIGGKYSHAIHKLPAPNEMMVHAERGGSLQLNVQPSQTVIDFAKCVFAATIRAYDKVHNDKINESRVLYLRVDVIETATGPVLLECEGVEPEMFFRARPESAIELADTLFTRMHHGDL